MKIYKNSQCFISILKEPISSHEYPGISSWFFQLKVSMFVRQDEGFPVLFFLSSSLSCKIGAFLNLPEVLAASYDLSSDSGGVRLKTCWANLQPNCPADTWSFFIRIFRYLLVYYKNSQFLGQLISILQKDLVNFLVLKTPDALDHYSW